MTLKYYSISFKNIETNEPFEYTWLKFMSLHSKKITDENGFELAVYIYFDM